MTRIVVGEALRAKLRNFAEPLELCDETGQVVARVMPNLDAYEPWEPPIAEEELQRREQSDKWHTFEEVRARLKAF